MQIKSKLSLLTLAWGTLLTTLSLPASPAPQWTKEGKLTWSGSTNLGLGYRVRVSGELGAASGANPEVVAPFSKWFFSGEWVSAFDLLHGVEFTGGPDPQFGSSIAVTDHFVLIGAPGEVHTLVDQGANFLFSEAALFTTEWPLEATKYGPVAGAKAGSSVDACQRFAAIGGPGWNMNRGRVWIQQLDASGWSSMGYLRPGRLDLGDAFGTGVSITDSSYGTYLAVCAPGDDDDYANSGAIYVYRYSEADGWQLDEKITPYSSGVYGHLGSLERAIVSGQHLLVQSGLGFHVLGRTSSWVHKSDITSATVGGASIDLAPIDLYAEDSTLRIAVVTSASKLVVLKSTAASNGYSWSIESQFSATSGVSVDIHGDTIVVGDPYDDDAGTNAGAVHVFRR